VVAACMSNPPPMPATTAPAAPAPPQPTTASTVVGPQDPYFQSVNDRLAKYSVYPPGVSGQYGNVGVTITSARDGTVQLATLSQSSGHTVLDQAAVKAVYDASPLPRVPDWIPGSTVTLQMTMTYAQQ
jgi:protein TonB